MPNRVIHTWYYENWKKIKWEEEHPKEASAIAQGEAMEEIASQM